MHEKLIAVRLFIRSHRASQLLRLSFLLRISEKMRRVIRGLLERARLHLLAGEEGFSLYSTRLHASNMHRIASRNIFVSIFVSALYSSTRAAAVLVGSLKWPADRWWGVCKVKIVNSLSPARLLTVHRCCLASKHKVAWAERVCLGGVGVAPSMGCRTSCFDVPEGVTTVKAPGGRSGNITSVAVLSEERAITGSTDRKVRVWALSPPGCEYELTPMEAPVACVCALEDDRVVAASLNKLCCWIVGKKAPRLVKEFELPAEVRRVWHELLRPWERGPVKFESRK